MSFDLDAIHDVNEALFHAVAVTHASYVMVIDALDECEGKTTYKSFYESWLKLDP